MRVVEPKQFTTVSKKTRRNRLSLKTGILVLVVNAIGVFAFLNPPHLYRKSDSSQSSQPVLLEQPVKDEALVLSKKFDGESFKRLYRSMAYPNVTFFLEPPEITGDTAADARIRKLAEERGYKLTGIPFQSLTKASDESYDEDYIMQPLAYESWLQLKAAAEAESIPLEIFSAYRSVEEQRELFLSRLTANGGVVRLIAEGKGDLAVQKTLAMTAIPGYSRHHTGYTIDFRCNDYSGVFSASICFEWLKKNNYDVAKKYGWIPSYPEGASKQGPEPEEWEYIWVGRQLLYE